MKKSTLFACLALIVYLITTVLIGAFAKQLNLIENKNKNRFIFKEKFHNVKVNINVKGYCHLNITEGTSSGLSFGNLNDNNRKPECFIKNDTLYVKLISIEPKEYLDIDINTDTLESITITSMNDMNTSAQLRGSVKEVFLYGKVSFTSNSSCIDTLNIHSINSEGINIDSSQIKILNLYHNRNDQFYFSISRSPMPEIRHFDQTIIPK